MQGTQERRNAGRRGTWRDADAPRTPERSRVRGPAPTVRDAWLHWLQPTFPDGSAYFTGTYSDAYGFPHGLMVVRNVHRDFHRFLDRWHVTEPFIVGVERHQYRDILHLHGIIRGPFSEYELDRLKAAWEADRGFARVLPMTDRCASYVTKYALKGDTDAFDWRLS